MLLRRRQLIADGVPIRLGIRAFDLLTVLLEAEGSLVTSARTRPVRPKPAKRPRPLRRSRDIGAYLGLVPRRCQSGEVDYTGSISKCGDRRVRTFLYEAANVMLTRYKGPLKLKDWAFAIAKRSTMCKARIALALAKHGVQYADLVVVQGSSKETLCLFGDSYSTSRVRAAMFNAALSWHPLDLLLSAGSPHLKRSIP